MFLVPHIHSLKTRRPGGLEINIWGIVKGQWGEGSSAPGQSNWKSQNTVAVSEQETLILNMGI
jgi:hypothetical protein